MMLECRELTKWFGAKEAVADLTLNLDKGKIYGLLGENGSGTRDPEYGFRCSMSVSRTAEM